MAERTPPLHLQNATTHTAAGDRALIHSIFNGREGVSGSADLAVTQNGTPNMSVNIASGRAVVFGDDSADQQLYHIWNDATANKAISAADPTNPRRDLVIAEVRDTLYGGAANDWRLRVVTGTPAASPADPSTPNTALVLARVTVAAGATSITNANITDLRARAGAPSSVDIVCTSATRPSSPFQGMRIYETDTYSTLVYTTVTTGWRPLWNMPWGRVAGTQLLTSQGPFTTEAVVPGLSATFTGIQNRIYRVLCTGHTYSTVAGDNIEMKLRQNNVAGYVYATSNRQTQAVSNQEGQHIITELTAIGTTTIVATLRRGTGSGNIHLFAPSAELAARIIVEDIGNIGAPV